MTELVPCQRCNTEILPATAEATGGYCMTCAKTWAPQVIEEMEARRDPREYKVSAGDWMKGCLFALTLYGVVTVVKVGLAILAVLIGVFVFRASWTQAITFVAVSCIVISFIGATLDLFDLKLPGRRPKPRREKD